MPRGLDCCWPRSVNGFILKWIFFFKAFYSGWRVWSVGLYSKRRKSVKTKHIQARPSGSSQLLVDDNIVEAGDLGDGEGSCHRRWPLRQHSRGLSLRIRLGAQTGRRNGETRMGWRVGGLLHWLCSSSQVNVSSSSL